MKKRLLGALLALALLLSMALAVPAMAANASDYPLIYSNFNTSAVQNGPEYYPDFTVGSSDILVQAITTYHWNYGSGATPGTISIYDWDDNLIGKWNASGRSSSGASNVNWDVFPNVVLKANSRYYIVDSDVSTWSCNSQSEQSGFAEVRGRVNTPSSSGITVTVNGQAVKWTDAAPFIDQNSRTMVPLRAVAEALGLGVFWNDQYKEASFTSANKSITFPINSNFYRTESGDYGSMDTAAVIVNSRTYAPIRYLAEYFGYNVGWDGATKTVIITGGPAMG
ncbi:MAG: copper amine oxidase N-terminal domain-containing protein [Oscillospiraceae bacterium]|nr:copper amine oxidase N-terminal domain-containing protein [Oscillospiraceae bacterium]